MTLDRALEVTGIRKSELERIDIDLLDYIIKNYKTPFDPYGHHKEVIEGYKRIKEELTK